MTTRDILRGLVARIVTRDDGSPDAIAAVIFVAKGQTALKAGRVYELREVMGEVMLADIGASCVPLTLRAGDGGAGLTRSVGWGSSLGTIATTAEAALTREELAAEAAIAPSVPESDAG